MKNRFFTLLLALSLLLPLLSACGNSAAPQNEPETNAPENSTPSKLETPDALDTPEESQPREEDIEGTQLEVHTPPYGPDVPRVPEDSTPLKPYDEICLLYQDYFWTFTPFIIGEDLYNPDDIHTYRFESNMIFEGSEKLAAQLMEDGKNPGLGVRSLHEQGITGEGVNVAIIDQNLLLDHPEYTDCVAAYYDSGCEVSDGSMHGPAVLSILAGKTIGVAPGAKVYFAAAPSWKKDAAYFADCLNWIIEQNAALPEGEKIRVVSVSGAPERWPDGGGFENEDQWVQAVAAAQEAGIMVIDCRNNTDDETGFVFSAYYDREFPEDVQKCQPGYPDTNDIDLLDGSFDNTIFAPSSFRTTAQEYVEGSYIYTYWGIGGQSWAVPYVAGVLALGWQVNPDLDGQTMKDLLFQSAYVNENGSHMIDPPAFIELVRETVK